MPSSVSKIRVRKAFLEGIGVTSSPEPCSVLPFSHDRLQLGLM